MLNPKKNEYKEIKYLLLFFLERRTTKKTYLSKIKNNNNNNNWIINRRWRWVMIGAKWLIILFTFFFYKKNIYLSIFHSFIHCFWIEIFFGSILHVRSCVTFFTVYFIYFFSKTNLLLITNNNRLINFYYLFSFVSSFFFFSFFIDKWKMIVCQIKLRLNEQQQRSFRQLIGVEISSFVVFCCCFLTVSASSSSSFVSFSLKALYINYIHIYIYSPKRVYIIQL